MLEKIRPFDSGVSTFPPDFAEELVLASGEPIITMPPI